MSCILISSSCRLAARRFLQRAIRPSKLLPLAFRPMSVSSLQEIDPRPGETHDDKNARLQRPLSPHLSIYRPQYTSVLSILHRISGTVFSCYVMTFALCALFLPYDFETVMELIEEQNLPNFLLTFGKFCMAAPLFYHGCNGIRHLSWDTAHFLDLKSVKLTGAVMGVTAVSLLTVAILCS